VRAIKAVVDQNTRKITRHPKIHLIDTGLAAQILGKDPAALARPTDPARGPLIETFVFNELHRQTTWLDDEIRFHHLRDRDGAEIDLVAESADGRIVAIEVKAAPSATAADARWLAWLSSETRPATTSPPGSSCTPDHAPTASVTVSTPPPSPTSGQRPDTGSARRHAVQPNLRQTRSRPAGHTCP
jgi:hypothetical protein